MIARTKTFDAFSMLLKAALLKGDGGTGEGLMVSSKFRLYLEFPAKTENT